MTLKGSMASALALAALSCACPQRTAPNPAGTESVTRVSWLLPSASGDPVPGGHESTDGVPGDGQEGDCGASVPRDPSEAAGNLHTDP